MRQMISVLVVDDEPNVGASIKRGLEQTRQYVVHVAHSGQEALALVRQVAPHVICLDMVMPRMTGADVAQRLRADPSTSGIPIVYLTGLINKADVDALGGFIDGERYLAKPVCVEELMAALDRAMLRPKGAEPLAEPGP